MLIVTTYIKFDDLVLDILALDCILRTNAIWAVGLGINGHLVGANLVFNFGTKAHVAVSIGVGISHRSERKTRFEVLCSWTDRVSKNCPNCQRKKQQDEELNCD